MGVSNFRTTNPIFVDPGVEINGTYMYCCDMILTEQLLSVMCETSGKFFIFQQVSAAGHQASQTISLLEWETPAFISPDLWLPTARDLNPDDYRIWGVMQQWLMTVMTWQAYVWHMAWSKVWSMKQYMSGIRVSEHVFVSKDDT